LANTRFELVTPSRPLYSGEAEMVVCRTAGGEIAFLAHHMPYIGVVEPGVVRVVNPAGGGGDGSGGSSSGPGAGREDPGASAPGGASRERAGSEIRIAAHGGFVEVKDNQVIMLADVAELASDIDVERARRAEAEAERRLSQGPDPEAEAALRRAQVRLEVASA
jgi:F-type H+-transporting ATPase subunit epsilon